MTRCLCTGPGSVYVIIGGTESATVVGISVDACKAFVLQAEELNVGGHNVWGIVLRGNMIQCLTAIVHYKAVVEFTLS